MKFFVDLRSNLQTPKYQRWVIVFITLTVSLLFIVVGYSTSEPGFPLDDAWIHQTYAKNLAQNGKWEFLPGEVSGGSTAPLWTLMLSLGFLLGLQTPYVWSAFLSIAALIGIGLVAFEILRKSEKSSHKLWLLGSIFVVMDWHILWSSVSGMETILYCFFSLLLVLLLLDAKKWLGIGLLAGLILWVRPDGVTWLGPILLILIVQILQKKVVLRQILFLIIPLIILMGLYGWFNYSVSGNLWPNTYYAKQMEYSSILQLSILVRLGKVFLIPVSGVGILLLPGFIRSLFLVIKNREPWLLAITLWFLGYGFVYALKLPATYQHGRYLFPLIPIFYLIGLIGSLDIHKLISESFRPWLKVLRIFWCSTAAASILFASISVVTFIDDLNTINRLMVQPAMWIKEFTPTESIIAAHDIGALGYFSERKLVDLAGLINPEVIPIIRDEAALKEFLEQKDAEYIVVFRDWYQTIGNLGEQQASFEMINNRVEVVDIRKIP